MSPIIFLDIDGVLNGHDRHRHPNGYCGIDPACVYRLNRIVAETGATIVISSAWRYLLDCSMSLDGFHHMLKTYGLDRSVHISGRTERDEVIPNRGDQIACYRLLLWPETPPYAVLDDGSDDPPHPPATMPLTESLRLHCDGRWVQTDGSTGLTDADADRAIALLTETRP